ncbi:MAG TPA: hypothetical protein VGI61_14010 [Parafilimonas sp.]
MIELDHEVFPSNIKELMLNRNVNKERYMLMELFSHHNNQMKALMNREYAKGTVERYETSYKHTLNFLQTRYKVFDIDMILIN